MSEFNSPIQPRGFWEGRGEFASQNNGFYYFSYQRASVGHSHPWTLSVLAHRHRRMEFSQPAAVPQQVAWSQWCLWRLLNRDTSFFYSCATRATVSITQHYGQWALCFYPSLPFHERFPQVWGVWYALLIKITAQPIHSCKRKLVKKEKQYSKNLGSWFSAQTN